MIHRNFANWGWAAVLRDGSVETGSSSTKSNNKAVDALTSTLANSLNKTFSPTGTTYTPTGATTASGQSGALAAALNPDYAKSISGAIQSYGNRAAGNELGVNDPLYAAQRAQLTDDVLTNTNTAFNNSGLFGSDQNQFQAARGLATAQGALDTAQRSESYGRQSEAASLLPQLLSGSLLPSSIQSSVGASQDADAAAKAGGNLDYLSKFMALLNGASGAAGTTTTTETPWWKIGLGTAATALGA